MYFKINNNKGVFEIEGDFTKENATLVRVHFNRLLDIYYEVVMSLKKVTKIDTSAIEALKYISIKTKKRSKTLFVFTKENSKIQQLINQANLNVNDY